MIAVNYEINDGLCVTPCPFNMRLNDRPVMVHSWCCHACGNFAKVNTDNNQVSCKGDEKHRRK